MTRAEYIKRYKIYAIISDVLYNVPASVTIAQGILESGNGNSSLTVGGKNHFGIKGSGNFYATTEYFDGVETPVNASFREYKSSIGSFIDHAKEINENETWRAGARSRNYITFANALQQGGYATAPNYASTLINIIQANNLQRLDKYGENRIAIFISVIIIIAFIVYVIHNIFNIKHNGK